MLTLCGAQLNAVDRGDTRSSLTGMQSQDYTVHSTVVDANGEPIVGAVVKEKGNEQNGTMTDGKGQFTLHTQSASAQLTI